MINLPKNGVLTGDEQNKKIVLGLREFFPERKVKNW
jgi:hypothetical protein